MRDLASRLAPCEHLVVIGSGADRIAARELALKIEEAAHIPTAARNLETFLHGHLPSCDERTGLVVIAAERREVARRGKVADQARRAGERVGMTVADLPGTASEALPPTAGALLATALPLQWLALELAMARGVNPDLIRREEAPYREAAAFHE